MTDTFVNPDFREAPFVEAAPDPVFIQPMAPRPTMIIDPGVDADPSTMSSWQKIMSEIAVIQRLEQNPSANDIVRMIEAANNVRDLGNQLVSDMQEHRNKLLRALGVAVPTE